MTRLKPALVEQISEKSGMQPRLSYLLIKNVCVGILVGDISPNTSRRRQLGDNSENI